MKQNKMNRKNGSKPRGQVETVHFSPDLIITTDNRQTDPAWTRLAQAVAEIVTNDATPQSLREPVMDFLHSNAGDFWGRLIKTSPIIQNILVATAIKEDSSNATN